MKKIKNLSEGSFLKLLFAFLSACFLIAAVCMPDRANIFTGLWNILSSPVKSLPTTSLWAVTPPPS